MLKQEAYTLAEASIILGVKRRTLLDWVYKGKIKAFKYDGGRLLYIERKELYRLLVKHFQEEL